MKILLVNDYGTLAGGAEVIVFGLRDALRSRGHDVRVFTSSAADDSQPILADDQAPGTTSCWRTLVQCVNPPAARRLRGTIATFRPDVVHVNLYLTQLSPLILRSLRNVAAVYYAQWYRAICPLGTRRLPDGAICGVRSGMPCLMNRCVPPWAWAALMAQMACDGAWGSSFSRVTAISAAVAARLAEFGAPHLRAAEVAYPGTPVVPCRTAAEMSPEPTIVAAGRLVPEKGIDVLIRAFARLMARSRDARLVVLGDGPQRQALERLVAGLGVTDRVEFRGWRSRADTLATIRQAWCLCVPSLWEEPFGMVAAEAQMQGVAVVASRRGGLAEIVDEGATGLLVPAGDAESLANRLEEVCSDRQLAMTYGACGHERARNLFSLDAFADRFERIYGEAMSVHTVQGSHR